jgi:Glycosyl transferase family 2
MEAASTLSTSVAMATYNGRQFLEEQLASIARQTVPVGEIVIADDCSTDGTAALAAEIGGLLGLPTRVLNGRRRLGVAGNFERAIRECSGEIVFLCDQDDIWHPNKVQRILDIFARQPDLLAVFTDAVVVDTQRRPMHESLFDISRVSATERERIHQGQAFNVLMTRNIAVGATMAFRSTQAASVLPVPEGWIHDEWIALGLSIAGKVDLIDEPLIDYRQHQGNAIGAPRPAGLTQKLESLWKPSRSERRTNLKRAEALAARLGAAPDFGERAGAAALEKCRHLRARAALPESRLRRLPAISRELASARYFKYSHGIRAALRDLLQTMD